MLKEMTLKERLQRIDDFIDQLTDEEFERICQESGVSVRQSSYDIPADEIPKAKYVNAMPHISIGGDIFDDSENNRSAA